MVQTLRIICFDLGILGGVLIKELLHFKSYYFLFFFYLPEKIPPPQSRDFILPLILWWGSRIESGKVGVRD